MSTAPTTPTRRETSPDIRYKSIDPGRMQPYQKQFSKEVYKQLRDVRGAVRATVDRNDALHISNLSPREWFAKPEDEGFLQWFRDALEEKFSVQRFTKYVRQAYARGIVHADIELRTSGMNPFGEDEDDPTTPVSAKRNITAILDRDNHESLLNRLLRRNRDGLRKIREDVFGDVSRVLQEGINAGETKRSLADMVNSQVSDTGVRQGRTHALTVTSMAHAEGTLERFEEFPKVVEQVELHAEYVTADDEDVCELCSPHHGETMTITKARGLIPQHPRCRCIWKVA